jgi:Ca2+-binding RTX toxin-like protein
LRRSSESSDRRSFRNVSIRFHRRFTNFGADGPIFEHPIGQKTEERMNRKSWFVLIIIVGLLPIGAFAGEVRVVGDTIIFDAGIGEVNTVTINPRGSAFDPSTGQFITGLTITDSTTAMVVRPPCRNVAGTALCEDFSAIARAVIKLGNKNDSVKEDVPFGGPVLPMTVDGGPGDDTITGSPAADTLNGGDGNDVIDGGDGDDVITGGFGDDHLTGGNGNDTIRGNAGNDLIDGGDGDDDIDGGIGDDRIIGGKGKDILNGGPGDDTIDARDGEVDTINCGLGRDTLIRDSNDIFSRCER